MNDLVSFLTLCGVFPIDFVSGSRQTPFEVFFTDTGYRGLPINN